jgi:sulfite reductase (NADPH) flavoprotein alpha-component
MSIATSSTANGVVYNRKNPFFARVSVNRKLTGEGSEKDTRHIEIDLSGSGMRYVVGDSLAVQPENDPELVEEILRALGASGDEQVLDADKQPATLRAALLRSYAITQPPRKFLEVLVQRSAKAAGEIGPLLAPDKKKELEDYLWGREIVDFLVAYADANWTPSELLATLKKLLIRLYSIASSQKMHPDSVHLTVAAVRYTSHGRQRKGVASTFLADRAEGKTFATFVQPTKHFHLPQDPSTPIIMVGPGTGIAPFRAFLQDRQADGITGNTWLFFGEQRRKSDFLYGEEFAEMLKNGVLSRLSTAFSRDQEYKIYVQHRMMEEGRDVWDWLQRGAVFYVCGDASRMAKDVDKALHDIAEKFGGLSPEAAAEYVKKLDEEHRYLRDVY